MPWADYIWTRRRPDAAVSAGDSSTSTDLLPGSLANDDSPRSPITTALTSWSRATGLPIHIILPTALLTTLSLTAITVYKSRLRRIPTATHIPPSFFRKRSLYGYVSSVGDGDNFRLFHTPGGRLAGWGWLPSRRFFLLPSPAQVETAQEKGATVKPQKLETIHVRIAGVDAPELAHFGRPSQPHGQESLDFLKGILLGRWVRVYLYRKDQYERVVAGVFISTPMPVLIRPLTRLLENTPVVLRLVLSPIEAILKALGWSWNALRGKRKTDVSLQMLEEGAAGVYEAKFGSEFGGEEREALYRAAEMTAKKKGIGMWGTGHKHPTGEERGWWLKVFGTKQKDLQYESPREYKTRMKELEGGVTKK